MAKLQDIKACNEAVNNLPLPPLSPNLLPSIGHVEVCIIAPCRFQEYLNFSPSHTKETYFHKCSVGKIGVKIGKNWQTLNF